MKPTPKQRLALELASECGTIVSAGGGYWVSGATSEADRQACYRGAGTVRNVPTVTVYACERAGWLVKMASALPHYSCPRRITVEGLNALAALKTSKDKS
jgi:hypothetical protein